MSKENLPVKIDNERIVRTVLYGPIGNWIIEQITKTDYDRQVEAVQKLRENGMTHGHVKMTSNRGGKITTGKGDVSYRQKHVGEYRW